MANQLVDAHSDYLLQHAHQPIEWWQWGPEALAHAAELDRPVMLSVGYASCHWCHVMSKESFDDAQVAEFLNRHFVAIKVDRQQHPDVDAVYMSATQALNRGSGGWPMTAFLTPDGKPFFTGTYYPPEQKGGLPSFMQVLTAMADAWENRRDEVLTSADAIVSMLVSEPETETAAESPDLWEAVNSIESDFDLIHGGFGNAPKFPMATVLDALLVKGDPRTLELAQRSLEFMARGGIHDQVGGGFHRYSVDAGWVVPHFEKMLDDNAMLLGSYVRGWRRTANHDEGLRSLFEHTAYGIVSWLEREMRAEDGAFYSALDADSSDARGMVFEGIYYLWNQELLETVLGEELAAWASEVFHVTAGGTFEDGLSTLQLRGKPDYDKLNDVRNRLLLDRETRFRPATDRLIVAEWNGKTITSLATGAMIFNEPRWLDLALDAAEYLVKHHLVDGELRRSSLAGVATAPVGSAEDHGAVAEAFGTLASITGEVTWLRRAEQILDGALELFLAPDGGFFDAVDAGLFDRPRSFTDHVTPSGTSALIAALRLVGALTERGDLLEHAEAAAPTMWDAIKRSPRFAGSALADQMATDEDRRGLKRATVVVVTGDPFDELARAAWRMVPAGSVVLAAPASTNGFGSLLEGRDERAAHVCRGQVCFTPVADYTKLKDPLWRRI